MFRPEMIQTVLAMSKGAQMLGEKADTVIGMYLDSAERAILNRIYPFGEANELPERYQFDQIRIAIYNINKRGAEGETAHIEVGTERDFASADIPDDLLSDLVPMCGVPL